MMTDQIDQTDDENEDDTVVAGLDESAQPGDGPDEPEAPQPEEEE